MGHVDVANAKSGEYHFFFAVSSVANWPLTYDILYMIVLVLCWIIPRFLPFLKYDFING